MWSATKVMDLQLKWQRRPRTIKINKLVHQSTTDHQRIDKWWSGDTTSQNIRKWTWAQIFEWNVNREKELEIKKFENCHRMISKQSTSLKTKISREFYFAWSSYFLIRTPIGQNEDKETHERVNYYSVLCQSFKFLIFLSLCKIKKGLRQKRSTQW